MERLFVVGVHSIFLCTPTKSKNDRDTSKGHKTCIKLWLICVDVWQKPIQHCKAIILQLKVTFKKRTQEPT